MDRGKAVTHIQTWIHQWGQPWELPSELDASWCKCIQFHFLVHAVALVCKGCHSLQSRYLWYQCNVLPCTCVDFIKSTAIYTFPLTNTCRCTASRGTPCRVLSRNRFTLTALGKMSVDTYHVNCTAQKWGSRAFCYAALAISWAWPNFFGL